MVRKFRRGTIIVAACLVTSTNVFGQAEAVVPVAPAAPTLWSFLGIPQGARKINGALMNRRGERPGLEQKTPLRSLNDPRNLFSKVPAIKTAAEIKQAEDLKPQKIKSIKYLTSIGCGCYDKDGSVTDALVAAMDDCTEDVRLATTQAIYEAAHCKSCSNCGQVCCCNEKVMKKLAEIAYERDDSGCYKEPSARVRESAAAALKACCPGGPPVEFEPYVPEDDKKEPGKTPDKKVPEVIDPDKKGATPETVDPDKGASSSDVDSDGAADAEALRKKKEEELSKPVAYRLTDSANDREVAVQRSSKSQRPTISDMRMLMRSQKTPALATPNPEGGIVMSYDAATQTAYVHFDRHDVTLAEGTKVHLRPDPAYNRGFHGTWQVVEAAKGCANLAPLSVEDVSVIGPGDHVLLGAPEVMIAPVSYTQR